MQDLTEFIRHSDEQLEHQLDEQPGKYAYFNVVWNNIRYQVHYVLSKNEKNDWEMMAYAKLD
ncbi:MAG TPA: hypothetical protein VHS53_18865 [Mucilaginibacter sp.]|nr:hypothetical protein [Mucilaginibacter sp.]